MEVVNSSLVLLGQGFTPNLVGSDTFQKVFLGHPTSVVTTPVVAQLQYPGRYVVTVQPDRIDIRREGSSQGDDDRMKAFIREVYRLWPLAKVRAMGVNFALTDIYGKTVSQVMLQDSLVRTSSLEAVLGAKILGAIHTFAFQSNGAKVNLKVTTDAIIKEKPGYLLDLNAHFEPATNHEAILATQGKWLAHLKQWAGDLQKNARKKLN